MLKNALRDPRDGQSGQALALGAGSMLVLALMLMFSFNISQAIHEKIRIQNYADAQAYSMAVQEARAFNYIAYTNRAMAAAYVSAMSLHAYMSAASSVPAMSQRAAYNFLIMAAIEFGLCCACTYCSCVQHCIEGIEDIGIAFDYFDMADEKADDVKDLESSFRFAMQMLELMINVIHFSQLSMLTRTSDVLLGTDGTISFQSKLKGQTGAERDTDEQYAPHASELPMGVGAYNVRELACAVEKPPLLDIAAIGCPSVDDENRAKVMAEVANGTRPEWPAERPFLPLLFLSPTWNIDFMTDVPDDGMSIALMHDGTAKLIDSKSTGQLHDGRSMRKGTTIGADDHGWVFSWKDHAAMMLPYEASIFSDENGGDHDPSDAHEDDHDFDGVNAGGGFSCLFQNNCFIKFRANDKKSADWGQPSVYAYTTQDLRLRGIGESAAKPWEITDSGELTLTHGAQGDATVRLAPGTGSAMSKALVYYHRLGDWKEQPNLFNPYWRAKLHPFDTLDAAIVLAAAGEVEWAIVSAIPTVPKN
ncbi:MAG: hypothetical protein P1V51_01800 [Deltaproteobacteria bacterium]|nr:hypothetical protein [Deltaproteobacteria bacterium]